MRAGNSNVSSVFFLSVLSLVVFCFLYVFFCDVLVGEFTWWIQHRFFAFCHHLFIPKLLFFYFGHFFFASFVVAVIDVMRQRFVVIKSSNRVLAIRYLMGICVLTLFSDYVGNEMKNDLMNCLGRMNSPIIAAASAATVKKNHLFSTKYEILFLILICRFVDIVRFRNKSVTHVTVTKPVRKAKLVIWQGDHILETHTQKLKRKMNSVDAPVLKSCF